MAIIFTISLNIGRPILILEMWKKEIFQYLIGGLCFIIFLFNIFRKTEKQEALKREYDDILDYYKDIKKEDE